MKIIRTFLALCLTAAMATSCGSSKETVTPRGKSNTQVSEQSIDGRQTTNRSQQLTDRKVTSHNSDNYSLTEIQPMYAEVDMNKSQIERFERDWKKTVDSWKKENPKNTMNNYERVEFQDQILRDILSDPQYEKYQKWTIDNAGE